MNIFQKELEETKNFLDGDSNNRQVYVEFQEMVVASIRSLEKSPSLFGSFVSVYSRADVSRHSPLKSNEKIALKLYTWRKDNPKTRVQEIHDIAGVTVCCAYPSDISKLLNHLRETRAFPFEIMSERPIDQAAENGYRAVHLVVKSPRKMGNKLCEIQIKTILTQSWGGKIHDLTYKPPGSIDRRLNRQIELLGSMIQVLDDQSDLINNMIREQWSLDNRRRQTAQMQMMNQMTRKNDAILPLIEYWEAHRDQLMREDGSNEIVSSFEEMIDEFRQDRGLNRDICRIVAIYAIGRFYDDRSDYALGIIDDWIWGLDKSADAYRDALAFRSCVAMGLRKFDQSIENARKVVELAGLTTKDNLKISAKLNLAYFLSEAVYHGHFDVPEGHGSINHEGSDNASREAVELVESLNIDLGKDPYFDTIGAVYIFCGDTESVVRKGLDMCIKAYENAKSSGEHTATAKAFFELHERRAFRKLLSFD